MGFAIPAGSAFLCVSEIKNWPRYTAQRHRKYNKGSQNEKPQTPKTESCSNPGFAPACYLPAGAQTRTKPN
jgi:hypothetical protein